MSIARPAARTSVERHVLVAGYPQCQCGLDGPTPRHATSAVERRRDAGAGPDVTAVATRRGIIPAVCGKGFGLTVAEDVEGATRRRDGRGRHPGSDRRWQAGLLVAPHDLRAFGERATSGTTSNCSSAFCTTGCRRPRSPCGLHYAEPPRGRRTSPERARRAAVPGFDGLEDPTVEAHRTTTRAERYPVELHGCRVGDERCARTPRAAVAVSRPVRRSPSQRGPPAASRCRGGRPARGTTRRARAGRRRCRAGRPGGGRSRASR
jgi:hypothetical protein